MARLAEQLDQIAYNENIEIKKRYMGDRAGELFSYRGEKIITINSAIEDESMINVVKTHELSHYFTGIEDIDGTPWRLEHKAEAAVYRHQTEFLMHPKRLIRAYEAVGLCWPLDFIAWLEIPTDEFQRGIQRMQRYYGSQYVYGQHVIPWEPFLIKTDARRKKSNERLEVL